MEILKLRVAPHYKREYPFTINPAEGITITRHWAVGRPKQKFRSASN